MTAAASLYEGYLDYKGPKDKHFKSYFAQLLPKQLLLKDDITSMQPKSVYIQSGKYGEGKSHDKKKIFEFYVDGMTGRHHFKVNVMSQRKAWLEYFKIADEKVDIGVYDQVVVHSQAKQPGYGNVQGQDSYTPTPAAYSTLPGNTMTSPQHYASHASPYASHASPYASHASPYASHASPYAQGRNVKTPVHTMPSNRIRDITPQPVEDGPPPLPPGREDVLPPLPPGRGDVPPPLPPGREDVPPPLPPGRDDPPPLPPGRDDIPPPLPPGRDVSPYGREEFSPASQNDEDTPPPLPPGRPEESSPHSAPASTRIKQQGFGFAISPDDLQRAHENIHESGSHTNQWKGHRLDKRDSGNVSGDGTIFHNAKAHHSGNVSGDGTIFHSAKAHHAIKVTSKSAPSSCEGQFGARSNRDEGYPTSAESTPCHSGGATFSIAKDHLNFKWCVEGVDRVKAEEMIKSEPNGTLLYRINGDKHVITIKRTDKIYHHLVSRQGDKYIFKGLDNVTGTSVYNIVFNYLEHCKGKVVPYGGSIDVKKEGHDDYDKPWNPPDVKILVSQVAKELEKKKRLESPTGIGGRRLSEGHKRPHNKQRSDSIPIALYKSSSSGQPIATSAPILEDEQTDYVNEGEDAAEDEIYENTEPEEVYLNTASRDDIYQNTPDITNTNIDNTEAYMNISPKQPPVPKSKLPRATPRMAGGKQYINAAAERVQDYAYSDSDHYLKLQPDEPEEVYEPIDH